MRKKIIAPPEQTIPKSRQKKTAALAKSDHSLRENESSFRAMADGTPVIIWVIDANGRIEFVNRAYCEFFGTTLEAVRNKGWQPFIHPDDIQTCLEELFAALRDQKPYYATVRVRRYDGEWRWIESYGQPRFSVSGEFLGMAGSSPDVTERHRLEQELLDACNTEQQRIGRDLHDGLCQHLMGIEFRISALADQLAKNSKTRIEVEKIGDMIREAARQARMLARGLSPVHLESNGLVFALDELAKNTSQTFHIDCRFECAKSISISDNTVALNLYRIAQESISNAIRHGKAKAVKIRLSNSPEAISLSIVDNGQGFSTPLSSTGMGLRIMKYRAELICAMLRFDSTPGKGTTIHCMLKHTQ